MLVDSHCHLDYFLRDGDLNDALQRAREAEVGCMVTIGTRISTFDTVLSIAENHSDIFCTVGVHPNEAGDEGLSSPDVLIERSQHPRVVGLGESGLDYHYDHAPREKQAVSFRAHIEAARETGLPLVVHTRDADEDTVAIMREEYEKGEYPAVIHCFTAGRDLAMASLEMGFYISLSGVLTFKSGQPIRDIVRDVPMDRLLVETDSPYLAPIPFRGKRNEPSYVQHTARVLAEVKSVSEEEISRQTTENFFRLFSKASTGTV
ncbi:TatD family hydrolase [Kiloniella sp. b19]|uniref:TatD family hydrolase n=1 Tax=Kiloniella sp. GXU_MW_B19 TaxID=3141326 RepID=UPI0031DC3065